MRSRAERYDWELAHVLGRRDQDLAFYTSLAARTGGPVLELACGTGRLTVPLGAVGLDVDADMLRAARRRGARCLVRGDMRRFAFARCFGLVVLAYNSLQLLLDDDDVVACLLAASGVLRPGGVVAAEVSDFQAGARHAVVEPELLADVGGATLHGGLVHDFSRRITTYRRRYREGAEVVEDEVPLRNLAPPDMEALLAAAGLSPVLVEQDRRRLLVAAAPVSPAP